MAIILRDGTRLEGPHEIAFVKEAAAKAVADILAGSKKGAAAPSNGTSRPLDIRENGTRPAAAAPVKPQTPEAEQQQLQRLYEGFRHNGLGPMGAAVAATGSTCLQASEVEAFERRMSEATSDEADMVRSFTSLGLSESAALCAVRGRV